MAGVYLKTQSSNDLKTRNRKSAKNLSRPADFKKSFSNSRKKSTLPRGGENSNTLALTLFLILLSILGEEDVTELAKRG